MRRKTVKPMLVLALAVFTCLYLPEKTVLSLRGSVASSMTPIWRASEKKTVTMVPQKLQLENQLLRSQMDSVKEWLLFEDRLQDEFNKLQILKQLSNNDLYWKEFLRRRSDELCRLLEMKMQAMPATVICREPVSWSSAIWVNVGEKQNEALGRTVIAKNSPVVIGSSLIGIVEWVGSETSRVRLLTDAGLAIAVRAVRGPEQNRMLLDHAEALLQGLELREDLLAQDFEPILQAIHIVKQRLSAASKDRFLAKGEISGSSEPLWRARSLTLKGTGFNYDYSDEEGGSSDLRMGKKTSEGVVEPLLKVGDLLITSGLDRLFPSGLKVASISKIHPLREGDIAYDLEAIPVEKGLEEVKTVFILPPQESDGI